MAISGSRGRKPVGARPGAAGALCQPAPWEGRPSAWAAFRPPAPWEGRPPSWAAFRPYAPWEGRELVSPRSAGAALQAKLTIGRQDDPHETEADRVADSIMSGPEMSSAAPAALQRESDACREGDDKQLRRHGDGSGATLAGVPTVVKRVLATPGRPLDPTVRGVLEPRFGLSFGDVRVHDDSQAERSASAVGARAYTVDRHIVFAAGQYRPREAIGQKLLAHELTHVVQQSQSGRTLVQRAIELSPPGPGEATAFPRRQELIDRLNAQSPAIQYSLAADGRTLQYRIVDAAKMTTFDHQMQGFIDNAAVAPLRLITGRGFVPGADGAFGPLVHDSFVSAYLDLDDLLASDGPGFQTQMVHILTERLATRNYAQRIGSFPNTPATLGEFNRAHDIAHDAEARTFQGMVGDTTIRFLYTELKPNQTFVVAFRSDEGYRIFKVFRRIDRPVTGAEVFVQMPDGTRLTIDQLRARRGAAATTPARGGP